MTLVVVSFLIVFVLVACGGVLLLNRKPAPKQVSFLAETVTKKKTLSSSVRQAGSSLGAMVGHLETLIPKSAAETSVVQQRLVRAGFRSDAAVSMFYGGKFLCILGFLGLALVSGLAAQNYMFILLVAAVLGFLAPDFWLGKRISTRQKKINLGLPDVLDLLTVCVEAGLGLDQAVVRTTEELGKSQSAVSEELSIVVLEQRAGTQRSEAWRHFADRTDVASVRNVVSMLVQAEQFGTSIAKMLRVHSQTLRTQRIQEVEEEAAKTSTKMLFPLVLLIFPSIFIVTLGPAVILMMDSFSAGFSN
jgi:tight adherence protein C